MAVVKLGSIITDASGSLGGSVIQKGTSGHILRNKPNPIDPQSSSQFLIRSYNKKMQAGWRALTNSERTIWNLFAITKPVYNKKGEKHPLSGHSLWMKYQFWYVYYGLPFLTDPADYVLLSLCSQTLSIYNAMFTKPDITRLLLINNLVEGLINDGIWSKLDCFWVMACHTNNNGEAQINWINPGTFDFILVNNPSFEVDRGFTGNGLTQYINNQYNPSTDSVNFTLNNASIGLYIQSDIFERAIDMGCYYGINRLYIVSEWSPSRFYVSINSSFTPFVINLDSSGFFVGVKNVIDNVKGYRNKIKMIDTSNPSSVIPNLNLFTLCWNNAGTPLEFTTKQTSLVFVGGGLSQTNVNNFTDRIETYMDAIEAGVI